MNSYVKSADDEMAEYEEPLNYEYLVVSRVIDHEPAVATDDETYEGGYAEVEVSVVSLRNSDILCSFVIEEYAEEEVSYSYDSNDNKMSRLEEFANSTLWENLRESIADSLRDLTEAEISL